MVHVQVEKTTSGSQFSLSITKVLGSSSGLSGLANKYFYKPLSHLGSPILCSSSQVSNI